MLVRRDQLESRVRRGQTDGRGRSGRARVVYSGSRSSRLHAVKSMSPSTWPTTKEETPMEMPERMKTLTPEGVCLVRTNSTVRGQRYFGPAADVWPPPSLLRLRPLEPPLHLSSHRVCLPKPLRAPHLPPPRVLLAHPGNETKGTSLYVLYPLSALLVVMRTICKSSSWGSL